MATTIINVKKLLPFVAVAAVVLVAFLGGAMALSMCNMDEEGLMACKPSVTPPPPAPVDPSAACCEALRGADLECLCSYKNSLMLPSLGIDPDLALALPPKCNLQLPQGC
ncbi:OLC1v1006621C1 [Oldenlandia corymbosa var. corymbosa]|uniref:OLC1v1006621C1 n=1 Tax=Oldenlandia corymbosa var. corymbosa TaxID=529605 RepID=A0AAV1DIX4_OLDCO|nr:OLC1v1006621C1 [Oldenlandia corymbosa var. corymbosa]